MWDVAKVLSIQQPWPWCICAGHKPVENRDWKPWNPGLKYRGPVLIHAGKKPDKTFDHEWCLRTFGITVPDNLPLGGIVGRAIITDCVTKHSSPWFFGPYAFALEKAEPLPFIPMPGKLGFFDAPPEVLERIAA